MQAGESKQPAGGGGGGGNGNGNGGSRSNSGGVALVCKQQQHYFSRYRLDLPQQKQEAVRRLQEHTDAVLRLPLKNPSPNELFAIAARIGLHRRLKNFDRAQLSLRWFQDQFSRHLEQKHRFWEQKQGVEALGSSGSLESSPAPSASSGLFGSLRSLVSGLGPGPGQGQGPGQGRKRKGGQAARKVRKSTRRTLRGFVQCGSRGWKRTGGLRG